MTGSDLVSTHPLATNDARSSAQRNALHLFCWHHLTSHGTDPINCTIHSRRLRALAHSRTTELPPLSSRSLNAVFTLGDTQDPDFADASSPGNVCKRTGLAAGFETTHVKHSQDYQGSVHPDCLDRVPFTQARICILSMKKRDALHVALHTS